jgi:uncharacterized protein GlcG (DUF336 family)
MGAALILAALAAATLPARVETSTAAALLAVQTCAATGQKVSVAIVGPEGEVRVLLRGDGAPPHSPEAARRKAYTSASFGKTTEELVTLITTKPDAAGLTRLDNTLFVGGGLPIRRGGEVIGGVGVSGANGPGLDEKCAHAAADIIEKGGKP